VTAQPPTAEPERLQKILARAGFGSRRASEELIRESRVRVNGRVATLGDRVDPLADVVEVDGGRIPVDPELRTVAAYYPEGPRVFPVGRLDLDSEGLLLLTNDGDLANRLTHPRYGVEKEYLAEVEGAPKPADLRRLVQGVELEDGLAQAVSAKPAGEAADRAAIRIVMAEGRKREIRRMLASVGLPVRRLVRVRIGSVRLGRLAPGAVRPLEPREVGELYREGER